MVDRWRDGVACARCWEELAPRASARCAKCDLPLSPGGAAQRCGGCDDLAFSYARAAGPYAGALRESILHLKRHPQLAATARLMLQEAFETLAAERAVEAIIPMPLHASRRRRRGFNQAELLARALDLGPSRRVNVVSLVRVGATAPQRAGVGARERARGMAGAFRVRAARPVAGRALLLIDDIMTTGATAHEAARALFEAGAREVGVLTLARASIGRERKTLAMVGAG
jgi:ComF family protein